MEPKTKLDVTLAEAESIRVKVRQVQTVEGIFGCARLVTPSDAPAILELLKDERASGDVYTLPRPFSLDNVNAWIIEHQEQAKEGLGLLMIAFDDKGQAITITDFQFWPEYAACEFGGVIAAHLQSQKMGTKGIRQLCDWVFEHLGVRLLVMTASTQNIRTHKLLDGLGFERMGELESIRPNGTIRRSLYWELSQP